MEQKTRTQNKTGISPFVILAIILMAFWWFFLKPDTVRFNPNAGPRSITARGDLAADEKTTIEIFESVSPSVVYITSVEFRRSLFSLNILEIPKGTGSGFIWDQDGRIVTNYHVIEDAGKIQVTLVDGSTWKAILVGVSPDKDIAVLQISAPSERLKPIPIGESRTLLVGQKVFAIGNPFGLDQTMTAGIVSAVGREIKAVTGRTIRDVIQTDAAINPGNSGGPLLDSAGRLIGINTAIFSPSGASAGIGFAVPVAVVNRTVPEVISHGRIIRPGLGVSVANDRISSRLGIEGVLIINVPLGSSAEKAGMIGTRRMGGDIILGDIVTSVNNGKVDSLESLRDELDKYSVGETVTLGIIRDGEPMQLELVLEEVE